MMLDWNHSNLFILYHVYEAASTNGTVSPVEIIELTLTSQEQLDA